MEQGILYGTGDTKPDIRSRKGSVIVLCSYFYVRDLWACDFRYRYKNICYASTCGPNPERTRVWSSPAANIPVLIRDAFPERR